MGQEKKYPYKWALERFTETLKRVQAGGVRVYEVKSVPLTDLKNKQGIIQKVPHGSPIWQHTDKYHVAMIYIPQSKGRIFGRKILDLIAKGVDTPLKFTRMWNKQNGKGKDGYFPKLDVQSSRTSQSRAKQNSYIVANLTKGANPKSKIRGLENGVHRTHLISAQTTGIERHKGLLIDFDGWLNMKPLNDFETKVLDHTKVEDVIWTTTIWQTEQGLHFKYAMYNAHWRVIAEHEWLDDRWSYLWYYDRDQQAKQ